MKAFIEKVFKMKKQKQKELLDEITHSEVAEETTEVVAEATEETPAAEAEETPEA